MRKLLLFLIALMALSPFAAAAQDADKPEASVISLGVGGNGIWCSDAIPFAADVEAAGNAAASLSPHLSLVGGGAWGFAHSYLRGNIGARVTATDADNPDFSVGFGISYRVASAEFQNEWTPEAAVGWRPWPERFPQVTMVGVGWYGMDSHETAATIGVRWKVSL